MGRNRRIGLLLLVFLLTVGFAAVTTNLIMNNTVTIGTNQSDFDVYFSSATTDDNLPVIISADKKSITFSSKELSSIGDIATLNYIVKNASSQYNADISVSFTAVNEVDGIDYSSYYSIAYTGFTPSSSTIVESKSEQEGKIIVTLIRASLKDVAITFTLTLNVTPVERIEQGSYSSDLCNILTDNCDLTTFGNEVRIGDEEFYVIGNEDANHVKLLSKYNLNVGPEARRKSTIGIQDSNTLGYNNDEPVYGSTPFSSTAAWVSGSLVYPLEVYSNTKVNNEYVYSIASYVDGYAEYLTTLGVNSTGRLLTYNELINTFGCSNVENDCTRSPYNWIYSTSYWTGTAGSDEKIWNVDSFGYFGRSNYDTTGYVGVRPVIIINK